jgi:hypothetical protein
LMSLMEVIFKGLIQSVLQPLIDGAASVAKDFWLIFAPLIGLALPGSRVCPPCTDEIGGAALAFLSFITHGTFFLSVVIVVMLMEGFGVILPKMFPVALAATPLITILVNFAIALIFGLVIAFGMTLTYFVFASFVHTVFPYSNTDPYWTEGAFFIAMNIAVIIGAIWELGVATVLGDVGGLLLVLIGSSLTLIRPFVSNYWDVITSIIGLELVTVGLLITLRPDPFDMDPTNPFKWLEEGISSVAEARAATTFVANGLKFASNPTF